MKPLSHIAEQVNESSTLAMDALYKQMKADGIDVLGFAAGEPDFPTPDRIKLAAIEAIINNETKYRSEERRVGKECNLSCRSRWSPYH